MREKTSAEEMVLEALKILQRGLPPGDLDDRQVITELWGIFDNPQSREVIARAAEKAPPENPGATSV